MNNNRKIMEELMKEHETVNAEMIICKVIDRMCSDYCKYPDLCMEQIRDPDTAEEYLFEHHCTDCPVNLLM